MNSSSFEETKGRKIKCLRLADWNFQGINSLDPMAGAVVYDSFAPVFACADADYSERYFSSHRDAFKTLRECTVSGHHSLLSLSRMAEVCEEKREKFVIKVELRHIMYRKKDEAPQCDELVLDKKEIGKSCKNMKHHCQSNT